MSGDWAKRAEARGLDSTNPGLTPSQWVDLVGWLDESLAAHEGRDKDDRQSAGFAAAFRLTLHKLRSFQEE